MALKPSTGVIRVQSKVLFGRSYSAELGLGATNTNPHGTKPVLRAEMGALGARHVKEMSGRAGQAKLPKALCGWV